MKKRKLALFLLLCLILSITAQADLIVEPTQNDFMREHADECVTAYRNFTVNSPKGGAYLYDRPDGEVVETVQNGTMININATWGDGAWAVMYCHPSMGMTYDAWAWIKLEDAVAVYDEYSFDEDFSGSFYQDDALVHQFLESLQDEKMVLRYRYPGDDMGLQAHAGRLFDEYSIVYLFKDEKGQVWGNLNTQWMFDTWVCLTNPYEEQEAVDRQKVFEMYPSWEEQGIDPMTQIETENRNEVMLAACLVVGVAVVSMVMIVVIRKKKRAKQ